MTTPAARLVAPDFVRGFAIVLMVFGHITYVGSTADAQARITNWIYTFHMPVFLFISGYFFNPDENSIKRAVKTVRRLVVPYAVFLSLYLIGLVAIQRIGVRTNNASPDSIVDFLNTVVVHPIGAYWFLHALILMTICFVIAKAAATVCNAGDASILILFTLSLGICCGIGILNSWVAAYYLAGMAFARGNMPIPGSLPVGLIGMVGSVFFMQTQTTTVSLAGLVWCLSIMSVLASLAHSQRCRLVDLVAWLGQNTLIILLCHSIFIVAMKPASRLFVDVDPSGLLYALAVTAVATTGCLLISVVLDSVGASALLFGAERVYRPHCRLDDPGSRPRLNSPLLGRHSVPLSGLAGFPPAGEKSRDA